MMVLFWIGASLAALGGFFFVTSGVGMYRFPDFFTRIHAAGIADSLGALLVIVGLSLVALVPPEGQAFELSQILVAVKLNIILFFLWVSGTTATHALAKSAWLANVQPWKKGEEPR